jgi:hypothetical protein
MLALLTQASALADTTILDTTLIGHKGAIPPFDMGDGVGRYKTVEALCDLVKDQVLAIHGDAEAEARYKKSSIQVIRYGTKVYVIKEERVRCSPDTADIINGKYTLRTMFQVKVIDPKSSLTGKTVWVDAHAMSGDLF